jgi:polyisoprenoid-binding protein YceI
MIRYMAAAAIVILALAATHAARAADWTVLPAESRIEFAGVQMGVPTGGEFNSFAADIAFDRDDLAASEVRVVIELDSMATPLPLIAQILAQEPWFDIANHPQAIFAAGEFERLDDSHYLARGTLTLRGVTQPVAVAFEFSAYGPDPEREGWLKAALTGEAVVQRTAFGIGQGEWGATDIVADDVTVTLRLVAETKAAP